MKIRVKKTFFTTGIVILLLAVSGASIVGCPPSTPPPPDPPESSTIYECTYDLIAGQTYDAGDVTIWDVRYDNGDHFIYVKIETNGWYLEETHIEIAWDWFDDDVLTKNGQPKPGQFEDGQTHDAGTTSYEYELDITDWLDGNIPCGQIKVAVHAVVYRGEDLTYQEETGWGNGIKFTDKGWAMYLKFPCCKNPDFYDTVDIHTTLKWTAGPGYWQFQVSGIPVDEETEAMSNDDNFIAWCFEEGIYMNGNTNYNDVKLILSTSGSLEARYSGISWDKINYIINHKEGYTNAEIQQAIWYFAGEPSGVYNDVVADANEYGVGYKPIRGGLVAVIVDADGSANNVQGTFMEVDP